MNGRHYRCVASPVKDEGRVSGAVMLIPEMCIRDRLYIEGTPAAQTPLLAGEDVEKRDLASAIRRLLTRWVLLFAT